MRTDILPILICISCKNSLEQKDGGAVCVGCGKKFVINSDGAIILQAAAPEEFSGTIGDPLVYKLKTIFKKYEGLYFILVRIAGALFVGEETGKTAFMHLPNESIIINLGSGPKIISERVINVDCFPFKGVSVVNDAAMIPFKDGSVDAVICECLLEHVTEPNAVVAEIERILKKGGLVYISIPFMDAYHSAPDDYYRWTTSGLRHMLRGFKEHKLRIGWGPTSTFVSATAHWLGMILSFGNKTLYQLGMLFFSVILSPLKLLDYGLKHYKFATNASVGYYFIGEKK